MILSAAQLLTRSGLSGPGWVRVDGDTLAEVSLGPAPAGAEDLGEVVLAPGLIDSHAHGGGGAAFTDGPDAARTALAAHLAHGTTSMMASLVTDTIDELAAQVAALAPLVETGELLGIHLEGPWLSPCHKGAHDPGKLVAPSRADLDRLLLTHPGAVRMVTLAPELDGGIDAVARCAELGVVAAIGHSDATADVAAASLSGGATVATHLFNAMRPLHHREPGIIGVCLTDPDVAVELICDGVHVHPTIVRHVARTVGERLLLVTDAMAAAGAPDGRYLLGPLDVDVVDGVARLESNGAIAGSTLTLDRAVRFAVAEAGMTPSDALLAATATPARVHGLTDRGLLHAGLRADLVVLSPSLDVRGVMRGGRWAHRP